MLRVSSSEPVLFCTPRGPFVSAPTQWRGPLKFWPQALWVAHPQNVFPNDSKFLGVGASFSSTLYGDPKGPSGIKFWQLHLGPFPQKKIPKFRRISTISRVTRKFY